MASATSGSSCSCGARVRRREEEPTSKGRFPPSLTSRTRHSELSLSHTPPHITTPPSGVSVRTEGKRIRFKRGAFRLRQHGECAFFFEAGPIWRKGGWKETRGVQWPISAKRPVSESRMTSLNPFETKRKKGHVGDLISGSRYASGGGNATAVEPSPPPNPLI